MIIWTGHGILIIVFAALGAFGAYTACAALEVPERWSSAIGIWGIALGGLFYAKTLGKTREQVMIDPKTGQHVAIRSRHTLFFIPAMGWAVIATLFAVAVSVSTAVNPDAFQRTLAEQEPAEKGGLEKGEPDVAAESGLAEVTTPEKAKPAATASVASVESTTLPYPVRDWTAADGRTINASLLEFTEDGKSGVFLRTDGKKYTIGRERFAVGDQALFDRILQGNRGTP
ncbi:MAG: hypothetical protein KDN19_05415 [Verrucomicrobiae bacterium]|nr:hypothetical protein [Verrucomicrobiae bacterium]